MDQGLEGREWASEPEGEVQRSGRGRRLPAEDGPRERLARLGAPALTDAELLAVLLGSGTKGRPVLALADALITTGGGLKALVLQEPHELAALPGLGPARAAAVIAALELGRRVQRNQERRPRLISAVQIYRYLAPTLAMLRREEFHVLCFNSRNTLLSDVRIASGSVSSCPVDPREVFATAISVRASGIVLAHNHPSGDPTPSPEDVALTAQLRQAARFLAIKLLDHVIVGDGCYSSIAEDAFTRPIAADGEWPPPGPSESPAERSGGLVAPPAQGASGRR